MSDESNVRSEGTAHALPTGSDREVVTMGDLTEFLKNRKTIKLTDDQRHRLERATEEIATALTPVVGAALAKLNTVLQPVRRFPVVEFLSRAHHWLAPFTALATQVGNAIAQFPPRLQLALRTLGAHGWYYDGEMRMSDLNALVALLEAGKTHEVDAHLVEFFERHLNRIADRVTLKAPRRGPIMKAAIAAHMRSDFILSVPVLLTQVDGLSVDLTGGLLFQKNRGSAKPQILDSLRVDEMQGIAKLLLEPLGEMIPINANRGEREQLISAQKLDGWKHLNRHQVLHGESVDYGTRINSLKAISLLNYIVETVEWVENSREA